MSSSRASSGGRPLSENTRVNPPENPWIVIVIKGQDQYCLTLRMRRDATFHKPFGTYCRKRNLEKGTARFFYEDRRVRGSDTPAKLKMDDMDEIEALVEQTGGGPGYTG